MTTIIKTIESLEESFSFELIDYAIEHQGGATIDLSVNLDFIDGIGTNNPFEYPDFIPIRGFVNDFLVNYPNETDFWEILNKNLVKTLLTEPISTNFGIDYQLEEVLDSLTVNINVQSGSSSINIPRSSTVTGIWQDESIDFDESWSFAFEDYAIEHQGQATIDITVSYNYVDGIGINDPFEYPEFTQIYNFVDDFLVNYPNETDFWEILNKNLVTTLLTEPIPTTFGIEYNLDEVVDSLTVTIDVQPGSSGIDTPRSTTVIGIPSDDDFIVGTKGDDLLEGGAGNDRVTGGLGNDTLIGVGVSTLGQGERDILIGNRGFDSTGSDKFILGLESIVFYDDGDSSTRGQKDLARILGFDAADDTIQLSGSEDLYRLKFASVRGRTDATLIYKEPGAVGEVIARIVDVSLDLSLNDPAFTFV